MFGIAVPVTVPDVPDQVLDPRNTWKDKSAYDAQANKLADMFTDNFSKFADQVSEEVRSAGPGS